MQVREATDTLAELEHVAYTSLETYSNVHRGSGHNSQVTSRKFDQAREIILEYLGLDKRKFVVIFCTPRRAEILLKLIKPGSYTILSSQDIGLSLGVRALAVERKALPRGIPFQTGGGTARLVSRGWVIWAGAPDRFEAGTPAIINIIAFARALQVIRQFGHDAFRNTSTGELTADEILYRDELQEFTGQKLLDELRQTLIGSNVLVPTAEGARPFINLDNGASTRTFSPIWNTVCQTWRQSGQVQQAIIHEVRSICAGTLNAPPAEYDVIFTSNTTEAINLAAESFSRESDQDTEPAVINTLLEHNSNELPWRMIPGLSLFRMQVDADGFIDLKELEALLSAYNQKGEHGRKRIKLVAVSGASNVIGTYNDTAEISKIVHHYGARLFVDAAQWVAHRKVDMAGSGIDYLAFSAHKVYAPFGSGALIVRKGLLKFDPLEAELIRSSAEENVGGIASLGKAFLLLRRIGIDLIQEKEQLLTARALRGMEHIKGLRIYGIKDPDSSRFTRKGGVIAFSLGNILPDKVAKALAEQGGIGVRYGCHCAHMLVKHLVHIPWILEQFQGLLLNLFPRLSLPGIVRVSLGIENSEEDVDALIRVLKEFANKHLK